LSSCDIENSIKLSISARKEGNFTTYRDQRPSREADQSLSFIAELKIMWNYTPTPPIAVEAVVFN
jgi:hypothetical protein